MCVRVCVCTSECVCACVCVCISLDRWGEVGSMCVCAQAIACAYACMLKRHWTICAAIVHAQRHKLDIGLRPQERHKSILYCHVSN